MNKRTKITLVATSVLLAVLSTQAAYHYWTGAVSTNWHDAGNWDVQAVPTISDVAYFNTLGDQLPTLSTVQSALVFRVAYASGTTGEVYVVEGADLYSVAYNSRVANAGGYGMVKQSGGNMTLHSLTAGNGANSVGTYNLSGGTLQLILSGSQGSVSATSLGLGIVGTGTFNLSGGTVETIRGVTLGGTTDGVGIFNVLGGGVANIGGVDNAAAGFWYQGDSSTLRATIDSDNGFSLGQINLIGGSNETPYVTFQYGALLDVSFSGADVGDVTNSWDLITWPTNTVVTDNGLAFDTNTVDLADWSFAITNNALRITYGIGSDPIVITNPPPSSPRTLYWTGNGGDTSATNGPNWDLDTAGTAASWGIYDGDTVYIGHDSVNDQSVISEVDYDGGAAVSDQDSFYVGRGRTGIFNMNSGTLKFLSDNTRKLHYIGFNTGGDGTLNVNGGELWIYATELGSGTGTEGSLNINGGDLVLSGRSYSSRGSAGDYGTLWVGSDGATGDVHITSGSLQTLIGVVLGDNGGTGTFKVDGTGASQIGIGAYRSDFDGYWVQNANSTLQVVIDDTETGVTPIEIIETGQANTPTLTQYGADVVFEAGSILDVDWAAGVTNYGAFDIMTFGGSVSNGGLTFASSVDTNIWGYAFVDADGDGSNDTLRVTAPKGTTAKGTPLWWLYSNGLTDTDDELDADNDGVDSWAEYVAGTSPTNAASVLEVNAFSQDGTNYVIRWQSVAGKTYGVVTGESLLSMSEADSGISGAVGETSHTGTLSSSDTFFYKIEVQ
jgi:hypothetical protein